MKVTKAQIGQNVIFVDYKNEAHYGIISKVNNGVVSVRCTSKREGKEFTAYLDKNKAETDRIVPYIHQKDGLCISKIISTLTD